MKKLRVLIVDDSESNRRTLDEILRACPGVDVAGNAANGAQALRLVAELNPDLITLDLEMPRMDGFTFLRLLMASRPTPVVVVSGYPAKDNVFRALELGALDFITKPDSGAPGQAGAPAGPELLKIQIERMLEVVRQLSPPGMNYRSKRKRVMSERSMAAIERVAAPQPGLPSRVVAIAASTGGPTALMELFGALPDTGSGALVVAQHMPERFTRTFAERLDKQSSFRVREAEHMIDLSPHTALLSPGGRCVELERRGERLSARVMHRSTTDRYAPSADRLFRSVARAVGERAVGVVLTGMGDDAARGVMDIKQAGGLVLCESEATAVVYGMPRVAVQTGCVDEVLSLSELVARVRELVSS
jgi:two-component system chemotaxis response regulator CheB